MNVGSMQTYKLESGDAGRYIRFEVSISANRGKAVNYFSNWYGPIRNGIPLIQGKVTIEGTFYENQTVFSEYLYDPNNFPESGTTYKWSQANSLSGGSSSVIIASGSSLLLTNSLVNKYIQLEVTPRDFNGSLGSTYTSMWFGPVKSSDSIVNQPPVASNVRIIGSPYVCGILTGLYNYSDLENNSEGSSLYQWLNSSALGDVPTPIKDATSRNYTIQATDQNKYLFFEVTPIAVSGTLKGVTIIGNPTSLVQNTHPSVTFTGNATICEGDSTPLFLSFVGSPPFALKYTNGVQNYSLLTSEFVYQLNVNIGGKYNGVSLTDNLNCPVTDLPSYVNIIIESKPEVSFSSKNSCWTGDSTVFMNTSLLKDSIKTWKWNFGDSTSTQIMNNSVLFSPKHKYDSTGRYTVQLIGENIAGCTDTVIHTINLGEKPVADFTWNTECLDVNKAITFKNLSTSINSISKFQWSIQDVNEKIIKESSASTLSYNMTVVGNFKVKLIISSIGWFCFRQCIYWSK